MTALIAARRTDGIRWHRSKWVLKSPPLHLAAAQPHLTSLNTTRTDRLKDDVDVWRKEQMAQAVQCQSRGVSCSCLGITFCGMSAVTGVADEVSLLR